MSFEGTFEQQLSEQTDRKKATVELIRIVSNLWYEKSIELVIFRNQLVDRSVSQTLRLHDYSEEFVGKPISIYKTLEIAEAIQSIDLCPARIDIGKLTYEYQMEGDQFSNAVDFVSHKLKDAKDQNIAPKDVVLYGFGRIGRLLTRELISMAGKGGQLRLRAIVTRDANDQKSLDKRAALLQDDSVHGAFPGTVKADLENQSLIINGNSVRMISAKSPEEIDEAIYENLQVF